MTYALDVRDEQPPHAVIGRLVVPYEAAIGEMPVVRFEERGGRPPWGTITTHALEVHAFAERGYRILAFKMSRERWGELKEKVG